MDAHLIPREARLGEDKLREVARSDEIHDENEEVGVLEGVPARAWHQPKRRGW